MTIIKCVVINGTEVKGVTYNIKQLFLNELKPDELVEFYLPKDAPDYCIGCKNCFFISEHKCPHANNVQAIWNAMKQADLIVFAYPVYALRAPGQIKSLIDNLAYNFSLHRPEPSMFNKSAVIITQSIGAPNGAAQKDVKTSLTWWGIPYVKTIGFGLMEGIVWDELSTKRKQKIEQKIKTFAKNLKPIVPRKKSFKTKLFFFLGKSLQQFTLKNLKPNQQPSNDTQYWLDKGWIKVK